MVKDKALESSEMTNNESRCEQLHRDHQTAAGRRHPSNLEDLAQFAKEKRSKTLAERCNKLVHDGNS